VEVTGKPRDYNTSDLALNLKHISKYEPIKQVYETTNGIKFGSPLVGPLRFWTTLDFVYNTNDKKELKNTLNIQVQDVYHVGLSFNHDLNKTTQLVALLALKNLKGDFFVKTDLLKNLIVFGCNHIHGPRALHSVEVHYNYDTKNPPKAILGQPLELHWAGWYLLHENVQLKTKFNITNQIKATTSWIQQVDPKLKIIFADEFNITNLVQNPAKANYNFGVKFEYSL